MIKSHNISSGIGLTRRNFFHPKGIAITVSGNPGNDAKFYQEKEVALKIKRSKR